jgi:hypothetical protein
MTGADAKRLQLGNRTPNPAELLIDRTWQSAPNNQVCALID